MDVKCGDAIVVASAQWCVESFSFCAVKRKMALLQQQRVRFSKNVDVASLYAVFPVFAAGMNGTVHIGQHKDRKTLHAVKIVRKVVPMRSLSRQCRLIATEYESWSTVTGKSQYIVRLDDVYDDSATRTFVAELCTGGSLGDLLKMKKTLTLDATRAIARNVVRALDACACDGIAHCDVKPANLMFSGTQTAEDVRLVDFGSARIRSAIGTPSWAATTHRMFTPAYAAPELFYDGSVAASTDMWSVGVLAYQALTGKWPFHTTTQQIRRPQDLDRRIDLHAVADDPIAKSFFEAALHQDPKRRLTPKIALQHPWLAMQRVEYLLSSGVEPSSSPAASS
jgi:serine/threonine protein kinase